jgi:hypothetical protein
LLRLVSRLQFRRATFLVFEGGDFFTRGDEQVAVEGKLGFVANGAVPWDDDHFVRNFSKVGFGGANDAVDAAAGRIVDEGIVAVPECVGDVENIGVGEMDGDVAVCVSGWLVFERDGCAIEVNGLLRLEDFGRNGSRW